MAPRDSARREDKFRDLRKLADEFSIELIDATQVKVDGVDNRACRLLRVPMREFNAYILETPHLLRYASHPHISGEQLSSLLSSNSSFLEAVMSQFSLERFGRVAIHGSLGRALGLKYPNLEEIRSPGDIAAIAFHPELTQEELRRISDQLRRRGGRLRVLLYAGFLSTEDLREIGDTSDSLGVDPIFLSFLLIGRRSSCGEIYAYGYDACMLKRGALSEVGCIITQETFSKLSRDYPPSTDLTLRSERLAGSPEYLSSLLESLLLLLEHPIYDPWQVEIILREAKAVKRELERRLRER